MTASRAGRLEGKVAAVTGASQGIGRAIAIAFAREGASVVAGARNLTNLDKTAEHGDGRIVAQSCDVRVAHDVEALVQRAVDEFGQLDVMCNVAGVLRQALLVDTTEEVWDDVMATNVRGTFFGCKYAIKAMVHGARRGSIINFSSTSGHVGEQESTAYVTSKGAVRMLTKNAAAECAADGIRVNAICPAAVETQMTADFLTLFGTAQKAHDWLAKYQPLTGLIPVDDIPPAAIFLASEESRSMTGSEILIDGGLMASWDHNPPN